MKSEVERAITLTRVETGPISQPTSTEKHFVKLALAVQPRPIDNIFTIVLRDGETEYNAGLHIIAAGDGNNLISVAGIAADLSGKRIDVILRPAPDEAERSIYLFEIWGEEIVFEDVLVPCVSYKFIVNKVRMLLMFAWFRFRFRHGDHDSTAAPGIDFERRRITSDSAAGWAAV